MKYRYEYHSERLSPGEWKLRKWKCNFPFNRPPTEGTNILGLGLDRYTNFKEPDARAITQLKPAMDCVWKEVVNYSYGYRVKSPTDEIELEWEMHAAVLRDTGLKILLAAGLLDKIKLP